MHWDMNLRAFYSLSSFQILSNWQHNRVMTYINPTLSLFRGILFCLVSDRYRYIIRWLNCCIVVVPILGATNCESHDIMIPSLIYYLCVNLKFLLIWDEVDKWMSVKQICLYIRLRTPPLWFALIYANHNCTCKCQTYQIISLYTFDLMESYRKLRWA